MEFETLLDYLSRKATFIGRSIAYYRDGREYGIVTIIGIKDHYVVTIPRRIVFSEKDGKVLSTDARSSVKEQVTVKPDLSQMPLAPYGKKYRFSFEIEDGQTIYISPFE